MNSYDFINGKKYKKCLSGKIRNPITKRCIKIKKEINNNYEIINGKKYKKCTKEQIRNPITLRCIKNKKNKNLSILHKKANIIQKWFLPFINRVSSNIIDRTNYYNILIKHFHLKNNKNYCIKLYKIDKNNNPIFRLGSNIILKNRIGSPSDYGIIYLSSFRTTKGKLLKFAVKMFLHENKHLDKEVKITQRISNLVINNICPHFIIIYKILRCNNFDFYYKNITSNSSSRNNLSLQAYKNNNFNKYYPELYKKNLHKDFHIIICELANGDLKNFLKNQDLINNHSLIGNTLTQIFISLAFFTHYENKIHYDTHTGNYLFHQVKKGGFYHYNIFNKDYYLENLGFLWLLWDFGRATDDFNKFNVNYDFYYTLSFILHKLTSNLKETLITNIKKFNIKYSKENFYLFINHFLNLFISLNFIYPILPSNSFIINKKPFVIKL